MSDRHEFCRRELSAVMRDVKRLVADDDVKRAWTFRSTLTKTKEFHGPGGFYWYGCACCLWNARVKGWEAYLRQHHPDEIEQEVA